MGHWIVCTLHKFELWKCSVLQYQSLLGQINKCQNIILQCVIISLTFDPIFWKILTNTLTGENIKWDLHHYTSDADKYIGNDNSK